MRKLTSITAGTILASLLLSGCVSLEKNVSTIDQQTLKIKELEKLTQKQRIESEQMKKHITLLENEKKLLEEQRESEELNKKEFKETQKVIENKQKDENHSFYSDRL